MYFIIQQIYVFFIKKKTCVLSLYPLRTSYSLKKTNKKVDKRK